MESTTILSKAVNVSDREAVRALITATKERFGGINGVANIAGVAGQELGTHEIWDISDKEFNSVMDVNVRGASTFCRSA